jgi:hypothetical protein
VDGQNIRLPIPDMTEERRKELVKLAHQYAEKAKIAVRNVRRDGNDDLKADEKKKEVLTEISTKFAIKFKRHDQIGDSIQNENHTVETLFSNIDSSVTQIRESIIKNASKAVLAIEKNREETIEKTKILESTDDLSVYENSSSNIRRRMKRSSSSDSFNVINDDDLNESFSDQRFD